MSTLSAHRTPRVLCIDDDPGVTTAIEARLGEFEVSVTTAYFGSQGIWQAVSDPPDVIITDLRMPNGGGDYVVECLKGREETADIPVIVLTGQRDPELKRWMHAMGVTSYLHKPMNAARLVQAVGRHVELRPRVRRPGLQGATDLK